MSLAYTGIESVKLYNATGYTDKKVSCGSGTGGNAVYLARCSIVNCLPVKSQTVFNLFDSSGLRDLIAEISASAWSINPCIVSITGEAAVTALYRFS